MHEEESYRSFFTKMQIKFLPQCADVAEKKIVTLHFNEFFHPFVNRIWSLRDECFHGTVLQIRLAENTEV